MLLHWVIIAGATLVEQRNAIVRMAKYDHDTIRLLGRKMVSRM